MYLRYFNGPTATTDATASAATEPVGVSQTTYGINI